MVTKKILSVILISAILAANIAVLSIAADGSEKFTVSGGWYETAYAEWAPVQGASSYEVLYRQEGETSYKSADTELVRINKDTGNYRVDIPGLRGNKAYDIKVVPNSGETFETTVTTYEYDRSGYAHFNYGEGVGAYNNDGTPKDNAIIIYVTQQNKNDVMVPGFTSYSNSKGIGWILNDNPSLMGAITKDHPLIIRIIGTVNGSAANDRDVPGGATELHGLTAKDGVQTGTSKGGSSGDNGYMAVIKNAKNVTIEGVGYDATIFGWGFSFFHSSSQSNGGKNYEVRNLTFKDYPEDGVGIEGQMSGSNLTAPIERVWVHNNTFYGGYCADPKESDKKKGDGSCDFKRGKNYTLSYNRFIDSKKTNLIGADDDNLQFNITLHHNWWQDCEQRAPLVRQSNIHIYNNYFQGNTSTTIDARAKAYVLSESNYFETGRNSYTTASNAVIKSFDDLVYNCTYTAGTPKIVSTRDEAVENSNTYPDFDTNPIIFYYDSANKKSAVTRLTDPIIAKAEVKAYSGPMKMTQSSPVIDSVITKTPLKPVDVPYSIDFSNSVDMTERMSAQLGKTEISSDTEFVLDNIIFLPGKNFKSTTGKMVLKQEGVVFKLEEAAKVTIKDGGSGYQVILYNSGGGPVITPSANNLASGVLPAGVYMIQSISDNMGVSFKEASLVSISIEKTDENPTPMPTIAPTDVPTDVPTAVPTAAPTDVPTAVPTDVPTAAPTDVPTAAPTDVPTAAPTDVPTAAPTDVPTTVPIDVPTAAPTDVPTAAPTDVPTTAPTDVPTAAPTDVPAITPTEAPTTEPKPYVTNGPTGETILTIPAGTRPFTAVAKLRNIESGEIVYVGVAKQIQ